MKMFIRRTFIGGLFFVVPATVILFVLSRAHAWIGQALAPLAEPFPYSAQLPALWAAGALLLVCFAAGLLLQIRLVRSVVKRAEDRLADLYPPLRYMRRFEDSLAERSASAAIQGAFVETEDALVPAFVLDVLTDGRLVVFVPAVPSLFDGSVYILPAQRVHVVDAGAGRMAQCVRRWGMGSEELIATMRPSSARAS